MTRDAVIKTFLDRHGWQDAVRSPLAGDASARRYERLRRASGPAILMDMPPGSGLDPRPYLAVADWLRAGGFSAPEILAAEPESGLVLIEDLGDDLLAVLCDREPDRAEALYSAAVDVLADLQARPLPGADAGWAPPPYDMAFLMREVRLVPEWYLPAATGRAVSGDLVAEYDTLCQAALEAIPATAPAVVLRDFHAENLIWLPDRAGIARIGILDFQDMLIGHPAYDLVSLLEDARRDTSPDLRAALTARYLARSGAEPEAFLQAAATLSAQRNLKILGLFTRLCRQDAKPRYLDFLPRVWRHLERDLAHPALADLRAFVSHNVPAPDSSVRAALLAPAA
jgi:aminoglycoside/choline kinase family phosphotransferase